MGVKAGYKQTEVGVIPKDWEVHTLRNCLSAPPDYGINASAVPFSYTLPTYLRITDITEDGRFSSKTPASIEHSNAENYYLNVGEIVFARTGASVGKSYLYKNEDGKLVFAGFLIRVHPDVNKLVPTFLAEYIKTGPYWNWVRLMSMRSGQPGINGTEYGQLPIPLPSTLAEQTAIVTALSDADALIQSLERLIAKKRDIKQGAMQELMTGKKRLPGFSEGWEEKKLKDLANIQRGASPRPIDSPIWFDDNSSIGWVRISDVTRTGMFLQETTQRLSSVGVQHSRPIKSGSLILSICATVGRPVITEMDVCIHDGFVVFDGLRVDKHFLYYILKSIEDEWSRHGQTGSQMNLNTNLINQTTINIPPTRVEQTAIATVLSDMDAEITALDSKLTKVRQIKQGMMQELLTGRIRLT